MTDKPRAAAGTKSDERRKVERLHAAVDKLEERNRAIEAENERLVKMSAELRREIEVESSEYVALTERLKGLERDLTRAQNKAADLESLYDQVVTDLASRREDCSRLEEELAAAKGKIEQRDAQIERLKELAGRNPSSTVVIKKSRAGKKRAATRETDLDLRS